MKKLQLFLAITTFSAGFASIDKNLESAKVLQRLYDASPELYSTMTSGLQGIAEYSNLSPESKDCSKSLATILNEFLKVRTEEDAKNLTFYADLKMTECNKLLEQKILQQKADFKFLPWVKVAQQIILTESTKIQEIKRLLSSRQVDPSASLEDKRKTMLAMRALLKLESISTEKEAQQFCIEIAAIG